MNPAAQMPQFDPLDAAEHIGRAYGSYLESRHAPRDPGLRADIRAELQGKFPLVKGPYLQMAPDYRQGATIPELVAQEMLAKPMADMPASVFPSERRLRLHQETAIRKARGGRNLVVATGTGSGKTECYLLPILDMLLREREADTLRLPGVRAMLLYPMNALANDQMERIRELFGAFEGITYGSYTGQTPPEAGSLTGANGELVSRSQMHDAPPHILLTNYAMLEHLLLRPATTSLFDGDTGRHWRMVVLDELHIYSGARGTEIAMLLRRVKDRVCDSAKGRIQFIGTSATLGGETAKTQVAEYASELFGENVETDDLIEPSLDPPHLSAATWEAPYGALAELREAVDSGGPATNGLAERLASAGAPISAEADTGEMLAALRSERHVVELAKLLAAEPTPFNEAASHLYGEAGDREQQLRDLLSVCSSAAAAGASVMSFRYHYLLRALEGAFACWHPAHPESQPRLRLSRHSHCPACEDLRIQSLMFEVGFCSRCSAAYILSGEDGRRERADTSEPLRHPRPGDAATRYFLVNDDAASDDDDDEAAHVGDQSVGNRVEQGTLCAACGTPGFEGSPSCGCGPKAAFSVLEARPVRPGAPLRRCAACSARSTPGVVHQVLGYQDMPAAVIATALYESLPPSEDAAADDPSGARKLLCFSDSRQDAAFFASHLDRVYSRAVDRRILWEAIRESGTANFEDAAAEARTAAKVNMGPAARSTPAGRTREARRWLMAEILATDRARTLDGCGLVKIATAVPAHARPSEELVRLGFTDAEALDLVSVLLDTLRQQAAVTYPDDVELDDPIFQPRHSVTTVKAEGKTRSGVLSWSPALGRVNRRLDYLRRVFSDRGIAADPSEALTGIWQWLAGPGSPWREAQTLVATSTKRRDDGIVFAINHEQITFTPRDEAQPFKCRLCQRVSWWSVSDVCPQYECVGELIECPADEPLASQYVRNLYTELRPSRMTVEEHTGQIDVLHARERQQDFLAGRVNSLSCTTTFELGVDVGDVQAILMRNIPPSPANYIQRAGRAGRRAGSAALAVSFAKRRNHDLAHFQDPLGLIAGDIDPPILSLANSLIIRRHVHAAAFAQFHREWDNHGGRILHNVHDFFGSPDPETPMPDGFATWLRGFAQSADGELESRAAVDLFADWLRSKPDGLGEAIGRIVPEATESDIGVENWEWVEALISQSGGGAHGWLERAAQEARETAAEIAADIARLKQEADSATGPRARDLHYQLARLHSFDDAMRDRRLVDYLASRVVLPKYGFPVDVVELDVRRPRNGSNRIELARDLQIAVSEYAPGASVVADKAIWESNGLKIPGDKPLEEYRYAECAACGAFNMSPTAIGMGATDQAAAPAELCSTCKQPTVRLEDSFVVPRYGFLGKSDGQALGDTRPQRAGWPNTYFSDYQSEQPEWAAVGDAAPNTEVRYGRQGKITVVNAGPGDRGFLICPRCGASESCASLGNRRDSRTHWPPRFGDECAVTRRRLHIGHWYLTDVLELRTALSLSAEEAISGLYALLAAMPHIGIPVDDVDGMLHGLAASAPNHPSFVLYDVVPGGAGQVRHARRHLDELLANAQERVVETCECAEESSCYGCLRTYRNQRHHDSLTRQAAHAAITKIRTGNTANV